MGSSRPRAATAATAATRPAGPGASVRASGRKPSARLLISPPDRGPARAMPLTVCMLLHKTVVHDSRVRREAAALAAAGHRVTVVELDSEAAGDLDGFARRSAAVPPALKRRLPFHAHRALFLLRFLARVVELRPDVVHAHDAAMLLPGLIGARITGARVVYDSHELATAVPYRSGTWALFTA